MPIACAASSASAACAPHSAARRKYARSRGTSVAAGQGIASALSGGTGLETGWANRFGSTRAAPCYKEGMKTNSGAEMARFLRSLGAKTADKPGPGPDYPVGSRC